MPRYQLQAPLLGSGQDVVRQSSQLLTNSQQLITTSQNSAASDQYTQSQQALSSSINQLKDLLRCELEMCSVFAFDLKLWIFLRLSVIITKHPYQLLDFYL